ncbi:hypothetical protein Sango_0680400 [Sesamum angolense]|uniref:Reverse transcriptase domain-containing protein n=1 Tax=Sesamum angolense TaxID=2727404 RepID=A0AAE1X8K6_9LAMI|nr:hypothetical protein Sango_0680400 [Sesamum angolense]
MFRSCEDSADWWRFLGFMASRMRANDLISYSTCTSDCYGGFFVADSSLTFCELHDLGYCYSHFMWCNNQQVHWLDRACANSAWSQVFPNAKVSHGASPYLDHLLVIIKLCPVLRWDLSGGRKYFHFEAAWLQDRACEDIVTRTWTSPGTNKIAKLERALTTDHQSMLTEEGKARRARDKEDITNLILQEEVFWKQRSKDLWLRDGDWKSSFFHAKASHRHQTNVTRRLWQADGSWTDSVEGMAEDLQQVFTEVEGQKHYMNLKLDISKAYDKVERLFIWTALEDRGTVLGVAIFRGAPRISHLLFVDDTCHNIPAELQERLADELGIRLESTHAVYLGLSTLALKSKRALFAALKNHIWRRIQGWHEKHCLTQGRRS